jgi:phage gp29-like protein
MARSKKAVAVAAGKRVEALQNWRDGYNPRRNLTIETAVRLCENYSRGMFAELMWTFGAPFMGIECSDPVYLTIVTRRRAAIKEMDWDVKISDEYADDPLAQRQQAVLKAAYERIDNLKQAIDHLQLAVFRGFAHLAITPQALVPVQQWNVARDGSTGAWRFNPDARDIGYERLGAEMDMDPAQHVVREVELPVGRIALLKDLRNSLSEKDWDAFVEIYGLPAWLIVGPPDLADDKAPAFQEAAERVALGGGGYLPNGSTAQCADSPRGTSPFEERLRYLNEMLVLAGTGGMLTVLAQSGSGTLAGSAHMEAFKTLAAGDAADISETLQKQFDRRVLADAGLLAPGEKAKAWFTLDARQEMDVGKAVEQIVALAAAGYVTSAAQVRELTGYEVSYSPPTPAPAFSAPMLNAERDPSPPSRAPAADPDAVALAKAYQADLTPVGRELAKLVDAPDLPAALGDLQQRLPDLFAEMGEDSQAAKELERILSAAAEGGLVAKERGGDA